MSAVVLVVIMVCSFGAGAFLMAALVREEFVAMQDEIDAAYGGGTVPSLVAQLRLDLYRALDREGAAIARADAAEAALIERNAS